MRTIAVLNQKGGTGKTTTSVNLAAALAETNRRVLLLDLDPQANASFWYGEMDGGRGLLDAFLGTVKLGDLAQETGTPGVDLVPSSSWLVGAEKALHDEVGAETILNRMVRGLPRKRWDYLIVDCPPSLGILAVNALAAVREVLVPVEAHVMALAGLAQLVQTVDLVRDRLNRGLRISGILPVRVDTRTRLASEVEENLRSAFGDKVLQTVIRSNVRLAEAPSFGKPVTEYDTRSTGAEDYRSLAQEVIRQERK